MALRILFYSLLAFFICDGVSSYSAAAEADLVTSLPRAATFDFKFFSGYLPIPRNKFIHYVFAESQNNPATDPLIFFLSGGPVCSGLIAFFTEMGPWRPVKSADGIDLASNPYSWNSHANVVFLEQPVGVGFSYSTSPDVEFSDDASSDDNLYALLMFLNRFPELHRNDIHIASEAYGGHFAPQLAERILTSESSESLITRFKGLLIGNPFVSFGTGVVARTHALWGYQLIPRSKWKAFVESKCDSMDSRLDNYPEECMYLLIDLFEAAGPHLDYDGETFPTCLSGDVDMSSVVSSGVSTSTRHVHRLMNTLLRSHNIDKDKASAQRNLDHSDDDGLVYEPCVEQYMNDYLNDADVREALHVINAEHPRDSRWTACNYTIYHLWSEDDMYGSVVGQIQKVINMHADIKVLVYSGDNDLICPTVGTQHWMFNQLDLKVKSLWRPWERDGQTSGYVTQFDKDVSLVTIHSAGHMAPKYQPGRAYDIVQQYLSDEWFKPNDEVKVMTTHYYMTVDSAHEQVEVWGGYEFIEHALRRLFAVNVAESLMGQSGIDPWVIDVQPLPDDFVWRDDDTDDSSMTGNGLFSLDIDENGEIHRKLNRRRRKEDIRQFVAQVTYQVPNFEEGLLMKSSMDTAFATAMRTGQLRAYVHRAFFSQIENEYPDASILGEMAFLVGFMKLVKGEYTGTYYSDITSASSRPSYDIEAYDNISWADADWDDDYVEAKTEERKIPWYEWVLDPVDYVIVFFVPTGIIFVGLLLFVTYRKYHDKMINDWGYVISDTVDDDDELLREGNSGGGSGGQEGVEMQATHNPLSSY